DAVVRVAPAVEQRRRSFGTAGAHEGHVPGVDIDWLVAPEVAWSPSRLESYQTCGFQFFGGYALGLREIDEENVQADAATRGTVMHEMLDEAIAPLVARGEPLVGATAPEVIKRLRTVGREHWDRAPEKESFGRAALWRYEGAVALDQLEALVWREAAHNEALGITSIVGGEEAFSAGLAGAEPPMIVAGRADRVDAGPGLIQIVDYKTGRPIEKNHVVDGQRLQLQLYALAARERFGDVRLVARYAFLRPPRREWTLDSSNAGDLDVLDTAATVSAGVRTAVQGGRFEVSPQVTPCPTYCAFLHVCRVNSFSRLKTWT
ncbi:MAG: PD-(D/E)XK nuclease family protein, partial [Dehalococcoidia bacterium]